MKNTPFDERISALADNELTRFEVRRVAEELIKDDASKARWGRYHLIGDLVRESETIACSGGFADAVMARIDAEPGYTKDTASSESAEAAIPATGNPTNSWLKPLIGVALAASVAAVSIFTLKSLTGNQEFPKVPVASSDTQTVKPQAMAVPVAAPESAMVGAGAGGVIVPVQTKPLDSAIVDPSFNSYLSTHVEFAAHPSLMPQIRVIGFDQAEEK